MSTEQLSWSDSDKDKKKKDEPSGGKRFFNSVVGPAVEQGIPLADKHESALKLKDPEKRVLPDELFKDLLAEHAKHVPIPVEQTPPPAARAERPVYDPFKDEPLAVHAPEATAETNEDDEEDDDDDDEEETAIASSDDASVVVPLDSVHEADIPTRAEKTDAVDRLIEKLDEEVNAELSHTSEDATAPLATEAATGPFMRLESEPDTEESHADTTTGEPVASIAPVSAPPFAASGGGGMPPVEGGWSGSSGAEDQPEPSDDSASYRYQQSYTPVAPVAENTFSTPQNSRMVERAVATAVEDAEKRGFRKGAVAAGITTFVVTQLLASRRQKRFEAEANERIKETNQRVAELQSTNTRLQERAANAAPNQYAPYTHNQQPAVPATHYEQPLYPQAPQQEQFVQPPVYEQPLQQRFEQPMVGGAPAPRQGLRPGQVAVARPEQAQQIQQPQNAEQMPQVVGEDGQEVVLQPGQRLERRGWYSVVVDEHGREVQGAMNYGEAFHSEQRQEQAPATLGDSEDSNETQKQQDAQAGVAAAGGAAYVGGAMVNASGMLPSGQADPAHQLPPGHPGPVDTEHRLSERQNPIIATLANPVLWLAFALLVIAYFIAALV